MNNTIIEKDRQTGGTTSTIANYGDRGILKNELF